MRAQKSPATFVPGLFMIVFLSWPYAGAATRIRPGGLCQAGRLNQKHMAYGLYMSFKTVSLTYTMLYGCTTVCTRGSISLRGSMWTRMWDCR